MARQKPTSRAAAPTRRSEKVTGAQDRRQIRRPARPSRPRIARRARAAGKPRARPKQRIAISHHRDEDFKADGLRTYAKYRDLGIAEATHGLAQAHVIRLIGPCNPAEVSKLHFHDVEFQMVYVLKGWVKTYMEGQGETLMKEGSCWTQPPRIKHLIMDYSDDVELLEVILPAEFKTVELRRKIVTAGSHCGMTLSGIQRSRQHAHDRAHQAGRQRARDDRFQSERIDLVAALRRHGAEAADHDAEAAEIGKAAHRIEHDQPRARIERLGPSFDRST